MESAGTR